MTRLSFITVGVWVNLGIFTIGSAFLPRVGTYMWSNPIDHYFSSRTDWDIAFAVLLGTLMLTVALGIYLESKGAFTPANHREREMASAWLGLALFAPITLFSLLAMFGLVL